MNKLLLVFFLALAPTAFATTWYVDGVNGNDQNDCKTSQTACKTIGHAISLTLSGDSIKVAAATYAENLTIGINLKVIGSNANTTIIDGGQQSTVVTISVTTAQVTFSNLTITKGYAAKGGGIYNHGTLTVNNTVINRNTASGPGGCKLGCGGFGGGIYNDGTLSVNNSTVSANTSTVPLSCVLGCGNSGGGIYNSLATLTVSNSTISSNTASNLITKSGSGGGGIETSGMVTVNNSTIAYNSAAALYSASGGGIENSGTIRLNNSTFASDTASGEYASGGGVNNLGGKTTAQNTIFADNSGGGNCAGTITSSGYNLSSDGSCNFNSSGDLNNTDPMLGPLQNNGGPTKTQALLSGSPAIDAGNPSGCTDAKGHLLKTDQRGDPRPDKEDSGGCDMGAYESQSD
jgi:hypothetical protein